MQQLFIVVRILYLFTPCEDPRGEHTAVHGFTGWAGGKSSTQPLNTLGHVYPLYLKVYPEVFRFKWREM
jgi:hypothetical protein